MPTVQTHLVADARLCRCAHCQDVRTRVWRSLRIRNQLSDRRDFTLMRDARLVPQAASLRISPSGICDVSIMDYRGVEGWILFRLPAPP